MTDTRPSITPGLQAFDEAYEAYKKANEQLDQKIEQCLHAHGPWPTEADYKVVMVAADVLRKAGQASSDEAAGSHA